MCSWPASPWSWPGWTPWGGSREALAERDAMSETDLAALREQLHSTGSITVPDGMEFGELWDIAEGKGWDLAAGPDGTVLAKLRTTAAATSSRRLR